MTIKELESIMSLPNIPYLTTTGYRLDYTGTGYRGLFSIFHNKWAESVHCFSPICSNNCDSIVRPNKDGKPILPRKYWRKLMRCLRELSPSLKNSLKATYSPSYTCRFNSGNGYANYLAFVLWRLSVQQPSSIGLYLHIYSKGFDAIQSFMILAGLRQSWYTKVYGGILFSSNYVEYGIEERLRKLEEVENMGDYSMGGAIIRHTPFEKKGGIVETRYPLPHKYCKATYKKVYKMFSTKVNPTAR